MQQIVAWVLVCVAAFLVLRHVWDEVRSLFDPDNKGCVGCNACETPGEEPKFSGRPAPQIKMTPVVPLKTELPPHLARLREQKQKAEPPQPKA